MLGFFDTDEPAKAPSHRLAGPTVRKGAHIPIASMQTMGCRACPSDKNRDLRHPKMEAQGKRSPRVYVLLSAPSSDEDMHGDYLADRAGDALNDALDAAGALKKVRIHSTVRCYQGETKNWQKPEVGPTECCRGYVTKDIEDAAPLVIIGIGDAAMAWATGITGSAIPLRGTMMAVRIGKHRCWFMPVLYPNFAFNEKKRKASEWELAFQHDIKKAVQAAEDDIAPPVVYDAPYDRGIEIITGQGEGDMARLEDELHAMLRNKRNALDWETNGFRPRRIAEPKIYTAAIGTFERVVAFPIMHPEGWGTESRQRKVMGMVGDFLMESGRKVCHHVGFEMEWTEYFWGDAPLRLTEWEDSMAAGHTLNEQPGAKGLGIQTTIHCGFDVKKQSKVDPGRLLEYPIREALRYNGMDSKWTDKLFSIQRPIIDQRAGDIYEYERKVRLAPTLVLTMAKGVPVDVGYAVIMDKKLKKQSEDIEAKILRTPEVKAYDRKIGVFRSGNDEDVLKLMKMLKRPEIKSANRDGSTRMSTDAEALGAMPSDEVPSAPLILEKRGIEKLRGTYVVPCIEGTYIDTDGRMRSTYSSMVAVTGRLNAESPNLQNFPKRKHKEVRGIVYAPDAQWIAALDYGQIEARVFGMASEDDNLCKYLWTGYDIHGFWADWFLKRAPTWADYLSKEFDVDRGDAKAVRKTARDHVKNRWVFPQFFGSAVRSCADNLHLDEDVAEEAAGQFWDEFRGVKKWQDRLIASYERNLYVETLTGRRERGPLTKNQLLNQPIQGTAADIVTDAMCVLSEMAFVEDDVELQPNLNVHDDLTHLLADTTLLPKIEKIARVMCTSRFDFINVPLIVEAQVGARWHQLEEIAVYRSNELFNHPNPYKEAA